MHTRLGRLLMALRAEARQWMCENIGCGNGSCFNDFDFTEQASTDKVYNADFRLLRMVQRPSVFRQVCVNLRRRPAPLRVPTHRSGVARDSQLALERVHALRQPRGRAHSGYLLVSRAAARPRVRSGSGGGASAPHEFPVSPEAAATASTFRLSGIRLLLFAGAGAHYLPASRGAGLEGRIGAVSA